jgi:hypothetical protein
MDLQKISAMRFRNITPLIIAAVFTSCDSETHEDEHGLVVSLSREYTESISDNISDVRCGLTAADGQFAVSRFNSAENLSANVFDVASGSYTIAVATNLTPNFNISDAHDYITINNGVSNPGHAYYGRSEATVKEHGLSRANVSLRSVLATLTVTVNNLPIASQLDVEVANAATGLYPFILDEATGNYGVANSNSVAMSIPSAAGDQTITSTGNLMPTVATSSNSVLHITVTTSNGYTHTTNAVAPKMYPGGHYIFEVTYEDLYSDLILSGIRINSWTEGWVINGEVPSPIN